MGLWGDPSHKGQPDWSAGKCWCHELGPLSLRSGDICGFCELRERTMTIGTSYGPLNEVTGKEGEQPKKLLEVKTMYLSGHSDGYRHYHDPPYFPTFAEAEAYGRTQHGVYAVDPEPHDVVEAGDGRVYRVTGPFETATTVEIREALKKNALAKLTPSEKEVLGLK